MEEGATDEEGEEAREEPPASPPPPSLPGLATASREEAVRTTAATARSRLAEIFRWEGGRKAFVRGQIRGRLAQIFRWPLVLGHAAALLPCVSSQDWK